MKLLDAIGMADRLKPNAFSLEEKLAWINELEGNLLTLVHGKAKKKKAQTEMKPQEGRGLNYTLPDDGERELLVPAPWDSLYWKWLCAMIDYANGEYDKYAASQIVANAAYADYAKWYVRTHPYQKSAWRWAM